MAVHDDAIVAMLGAIPRGKQWLDSSAAENHGTLNGGAAWNTSEARPFVRTATPGTDYPLVSFGGDLGLSVFSVACWVRFPPATGNKSILSFTTDNSNPFSRFYIYGQGASLNSISTIAFNGSVGASHTGLSLPFNTWHFIGASRDADGYMTTYVNNRTPIRGTSPTASDFAIITAISGLWSVNNAYIVPGDIADVSLWDRELSAGEFAALADPRYFPLGAGNRGFPLSRLVN